MGKLANIKKAISWVAGTLCAMLFVANAPVEFIGLQLVSGAAFVGVLAWNGMFKEAAWTNK